MINIPSRGQKRINHCGRWFLHKFRIASAMVYLKGVRNRDIQARINKGSLAAFA
jgi:hypothetical protein